MKHEKGSSFNSWYRWFLGQDFFKTLNDYGRLPLEMDFDKLMQDMKESDKTIQKLAEKDEIIKTLNQLGYDELIKEVK